MRSFRTFYGKNVVSAHLDITVYTVEYGCIITGDGERLVARVASIYIWEPELPGTREGAGLFESCSE